MSEIKNLTSSETSAYNYIIANLADIPKLTVRELSVKSNVSPTTLLRCIKKIGYISYQEFKYTVSRTYDSVNEGDQKFGLLLEIKKFFDEKIIETYQDQFRITKKIILASEFMIFCGIGTSGVLAEYGARQFSNVGFNAHFSNDPFFPFRLGKMSNTVVGLIFSVSGETKETLDQTKALKEQGTRIISMTNDSSNSLAKLSDVNFAYNMKPEIVGRDLNITTQVPVIFLIEWLVRELSNSEKIREDNPQF
ncbi:MurR/RpiR family transcriptional regulator [Oenococcus sicerae]|uniref:MurR/RpiR family transcriptional regulator n=1 Tax=Oenococcus sicerae TaxID=2203724 RepID=A0AAJ1RA37_9LACO|nr:MurR/RpiR family transcriptional regulator [Oenococcus sicerae]MDN6900020.1 MurR/RpiR family transcriptional regulator [Oenococcus sicerae]QAS69630.1 MurR/RpiR family transcriptional regulator [Oenococcus sicerae]